MLKSLEDYTLKGISEKVKEVNKLRVSYILK